MKLSGSAPMKKSAGRQAPRTERGARYRLRFDGAIKKNPGGLIGYGWCILDGEDVLSQGSGGLAEDHDNTVNVAEYQGLLHGLHGLGRLLGVYEAPDIRHVLVEGDSKLVINQVSGVWSVRQDHLKKLHTRVSTIASELREHLLVELTFGWIPRDQNEQADLLSKEGYDKA